MASTLFLLCPSQLNQGSAENNYNDNCRGQWAAQTVTQCPGWGGSKSWYQGHTQLRTYRNLLQLCLHKFNSVRYIYKYITADRTDSAFWASSVQCWYQDGGKAVQPPQMSGFIKKKGTYRNFRQVRFNNLTLKLNKKQLKVASQGLKRTN